MQSLVLEFETNGSGWLGYIAELPGAFVRGASEAECLGKVPEEIERYALWLGTRKPGRIAYQTERVHRSPLCVEDADNEILLAFDRPRLDAGIFDSWIQVADRSGKCFQDLYENVTDATWKDPARLRTTFLGDCPSSIREVFTHVDRVQQYYLSCLDIPDMLREGSFSDRRSECLDRITELYESGLDDIRWNSHEGWTIAKALRRYIWHDRIHAKSIVRSLRRQIELGLIDAYIDPYKFGNVSTAIRTELL